MSNSIEEPSIDEVLGGIACLESFNDKECRAFLGLFGPRIELTIFSNRKSVVIGKPNCEWVEDWREFYMTRLVDAGLLLVSETAPHPAVGLTLGITFTKITFEPTALGCQVREMWWTRLRSRAAALSD